MTAGCIGLDRTQLLGVLVLVALCSSLSFGLGVLFAGRVRDE
jgi:hypothetical protein